jgi:hypothetical protein
MSRRASRALRYGMLTLALLLAVTARVVVESRSAWSFGEAARESGDLRAAIFHYRTSARWYAPLSPWPVRSLEALLDIGRKAESRGDDLVALEAYDAVRSATLGARSFYTPHEGYLRQANERLPAVMARAREVHPAGPRSTPADRPELEARFASDLQRDHAPAALPSVIAVLAFLGWVGVMVAGIWRSLPDEVGLRRGVALRWGAASAGLFGLWLSSLALV